jgi:two-component system, NtrC family, sensor kinase
VEYQDLPPGDYVFQVTAVDRDLNYSMPARVQITVTADMRDEKIDALEARVRERIRHIMAGDGVLADPGAGARVDRVLELLETSNATTETAIQRIRSMTESLKDFANLDQAAVQQADLHEGLESTLALPEHEFGQRIQVQTDYGELPRIRCQPPELNQVFLNALMNAAQSIEGLGQLSIRTFRAGASICVEIRDNGRGIAADRLERILDPAISRQGERVGMGLGLATSLNIVRRHGGELKIKSRLGEGTAVTVVLPADSA